ncbi:EAL domain-containing protein [Pseudoalteromonas sp. C2R02]|uniref:sensor domain-containing protein n=1 Tax=Pseudoalteromonas sp. C2R02 TaxID=2841565 RepID=UPI001C086B11|nr:EAL domain-containing protein [Pseudoalteromonas sp. C2R02]MBU2968669.1 EAL domain-containing protein [Pseudoalteromonas sp. C2R02]
MKQLNLKLKGFRFHLFIYLIFVIAMSFIGLRLEKHYEAQSEQDLNIQLSSYNQVFQNKLRQLENLLYAFDAYFQSSSNISSKSFYKVAQSQLQGIEIEVGLEQYVLFKSEQIEEIQTRQIKQGQFDFRLYLPAKLEDDLMGVIKAAPVSDYGHNIGQVIALNENELTKLSLEHGVVALNWPQKNDQWSLVLIQKVAGKVHSALGLRLALSSLLENLYHNLYAETGEHIRLINQEEVIFTTDWKGRFNLDEIKASVSTSSQFFSHELTLELYNPESLSPPVLPIRLCVIISLVVVSWMCGALILFQIFALKGRNREINRIVVQRTASLVDSNRELKKESLLKTQALKQQIKSENQYTKLFVNSHEGLFILDCNENIKTFNPAFSSLLLDNDIDKKNVSFSRFIYSPDQTLQWQQDVKNKLNHQEFEWLAKKQNGKSIWVRQSGNWVKNDGIWSYEGRLVDITQAKLFNEQLKYRAQYDSLTNLLNRQTFLELLDKLRFSSQSRFILLYIDLDRFKLINDTLGHVAGDKVLIEFAARMQNLLGPFSDIARLGGDEFAVLIRQNHLSENLIGLLINILEEIRKPFNYNEHSLSVSGSIGVRKFTSPCIEYDAKKLIHDADIAMYEAKQQGKNDYYIFSSKLSQQINRRLQIETLLHDLIPDLELSINLQPLYCKLGIRLIGFEALLRWDSDELGRISPEEFIPIAEECGKMSLLGKWVFERALRFMEQLGDKSQDLFININVSPLQLQQNSFMHWLTNRVNQSPLSRRQIRIELTESAMMAKEAALIEQLKEIHKLGIGIYIDDFGTGYSSLSRIKNLPIDGIKIDRSFIENIETDNGVSQLVKAICAIAESFHLSVTVEGVETQAQLTVLKSLYCHQFQGYFFSKPLTEKQMIKRIDEESKNIVKIA